jgi:predicted nucleic acid-binding protein
VDTEQRVSIVAPGTKNINKRELLDSSALSKFALKEPGWTSVESHLPGGNSIELALKETSNALWKKIQRHDVELGSAKKIIQILSETLWFLDQREYMMRALEISAEHGITTYDSLFLACAEIEGLVLVSCDEKQLEIARLLRIDTLKP